MSKPRPAYVFVAILACCVAGCVDGIPDVSVDRGDVRSAIAKGTLKSPKAASIAFVSLEGAPPDAMARFQRQFSAAAVDREITVAEAKAARYQVRGYMSANPTETGTALTYVYDLFDEHQHRIERVSDVLTVPGAGPDVWRSVDDAALSSLAGRSADDLAVALAGMPDRQAVAALGAVH